MRTTEKQPVGRPEKPADEKQVKVSISIWPIVFKFLQSLPNRSEFVNKAILEKIQRLQK